MANATQTTRVLMQLQIVNGSEQETCVTPSPVPSEWLMARRGSEASALQQLLPAALMKIVATGEKEDRHQDQTATSSRYPGLPL